MKILQRVNSAQHRFRETAVGLLAAGVITLGAAEDAFAAQDQVGSWTVFTATDNFSVDGEDTRWLYWIDTQARYFDIGSGRNQWLVRPAIGYKPGANLSVWAGYARFRSRGASGAVVDENRFWQQLSWTVGQWQGGTISMRARLLERTVDVGDDTGYRLRFMTKFVKPIGTDGKKDLILSLEPMFDLNDTDWGGDGGIAQNRAYIGIGWNVSPRLRIETAYMNQYLWSDTREDTSNHLAVVNFRTSF